MIEYKKPKMKFVNWRNKESVAAGDCWSNSPNNGGKEWCYDIPGKGYVWFKMTGNCEKFSNIDACYPETLLSERKDEVEQLLQDAITNQNYNAKYFNPGNPGDGWS